MARPGHSDSLGTHDFSDLRIVNRDLQGAELKRLNVPAHKLQPGWRDLLVRPSLIARPSLLITCHPQFGEDYTINIYYVNRD